MILNGCSVRPGNVLLPPDNRRTSNSRSYNVNFSSIRPSTVAFTWTPPKCLGMYESIYETTILAFSLIPLSAGRFNSIKSA